MFGYDQKRVINALMRKSELIQVWWKKKKRVKECFFDKKKGKGMLK